jgi:hypothetical protein
MTDTGLRIANYKCFGNEPQGFDSMKPINILIGRNNSGKTALLEAVELATKGLAGVDRSLFNGANEPSLHYKTVLTEAPIRSVFPENTSGGGISGSHWAFGRRWVGATLEWYETGNRQKRFAQLDPPLAGLTNPQSYLDQLTAQMTMPFMHLSVLRLVAERDIPREGEGTYEEVDVEPDGRGATRLIHSVLNQAERSRELVSDLMLNELNAIVSPDLRFSGIVTRRYKTNFWEIFLQDQNGRLIALSHMGSGLKTVILILTLLHLVPRLRSLDPAKTIYCFEELENHLHPTIQRSLLAYLRSHALENGSKFFISTHSSVAIDVFARDEEAQILHVAQEDSTATIRPVTTYVQHKGILDDLDIRASDILQANGIIWVEGPSDRILLNRWISLWSDNHLSEGTHYQVVFYGGRLLAHLSAASPDESVALVSILRTNRNAAIVIDSDKRAKATRVNDTKKRLAAEVANADGYCWITDGKEIENYISTKVLQRMYPGKTVPAFDKYSPIDTVLDQIVPNEGSRFLRGKPSFAEKAAGCFELTDIQTNEHLRGSIEQLCKKIRQWNCMHG